MEWDFEVSSGQKRERWLWSSALKPLQNSADILGFAYQNSKEVGRSLSPTAKNDKVVPSYLRYESLCKDTHMTGRSLTAWLVSILLSVLLSVWTVSPWLSYLIGRCTCLHLQHSHACAWPWTLLNWTQTAEWLSGLSSDMSCYYRLAQQSLDWILDPLADRLLSLTLDLSWHHKLLWRSGFSADRCCLPCVHLAHLAWVQVEWTSRWQGPCPASFVITLGSQLHVP